MGNDNKLFGVKVRYQVDVTFEGRFASPDELLAQLGGSFLEMSDSDFSIDVRGLAEKGIKLVETDTYADPGPTRTYQSPDWECYQRMGGDE